MDEKERTERRARKLAADRHKRKERDYAKSLRNFLNGRARVPLAVPYDEGAHAYRDAVEAQLRAYLTSWVECRFDLKTWSHMKAVERDIQRLHWILATDEDGRPRLMPSYLDMTDGFMGAVPMDQKIGDEEYQHILADDDPTATARVEASRRVYRLLVSSYYDKIRKCKNPSCSVYILQESENEHYCNRRCRPKSAIASVKKKRDQITRARNKAIAAAIQELSGFTEARRASLTSGKAKKYKSLSHWIAAKASEQLANQGFADIHVNTVTRALKRHTVIAPEWVTNSNAKRRN